MKKSFRLLIGFAVAAPVALLTHLLSIYTGKQKAVELLGPAVTILAQGMQQFFPPKIHNASEFDLFKSKLRDKQKIWRMLYDYPIEYPDEDTAQLVIRNCPFAEAVVHLKISEMGYYMCRGDWEVAKVNSGKWKFERRCTIGTGGTLCDFTYKRIHNNR